MMGTINKFTELLTIFYCKNSPLHRAKGAQIINNGSSGGCSASSQSRIILFLKGNNKQLPAPIQADSRLVYGFMDLQKEQKKESTKETTIVFV